MNRLQLVMFSTRSHEEADVNKMENDVVGRFKKGSLNVSLYQISWLSSGSHSGPRSDLFSDWGGDTGLKSARKLP